MNDRIKELEEELSLSKRRLESAMEQFEIAKKGWAEATNQKNALLRATKYMYSLLTRASLSKQDQAQLAGMQFALTQLGVFRKDTLQ